MGWNESEAILLAPGWQIFVEASAKGRTADGVPVQFLCSERIEEPRAKGIDPATVQAWLEERGFELRERTTSLIQLTLDDIDAFLCIDGDQLAQVSLRFTLKRISPTRWAIWIAFVELLSEEWGLELYDPDRGRKVDASDILQVLADTQAWRDFEANFKWPPVGH